MQAGEIPLVSTIHERCRLCYTCVRECPAKAIRVAEGQAQVLLSRCIGCGNCVKVCSQRAKAIRSGRGEVEVLLDSGARVSACLAPSFPAEFMDIDEEILIGMVRAMGFTLVNEVAFGADLVAAAYRELLGRDVGRRYIATTCPAIVGYVERYHPELVEKLAPIVSPMLATARAVRAMHGDDVRVVFIGPCVAKKGEWSDQMVDAVLTFTELRELLASRSIKPEATPPSDFDLPQAGAGRLFAIGGGLLQAASIPEDLVTGEVVTAQGRTAFIDAIREFESGDLDARLLEVLCCEGCIMGPGISHKAPQFKRRARVSQYVRRRMERLDREGWERNVHRFVGLAVSRNYTPQDQRIRMPSAAELEEILGRMGKISTQDELDCGACGYETCREHAMAIYKGLAESEMCLPYTIEQLRKTCAELAKSNERLADTQEALIHAEKMASMGQLAAGIAHEVNNPLSTVVMLSHLLLEEVDEEGETREDLAMIVEEADRCKKIVAGLLQFARQNRVDARQTDLGELVERSIRTAQVPAGIAVNLESRNHDALAEVDRDQILQVLANLINNALVAMPSGGTLTIALDGDAENVRLTVRDTGTGIPPENMKKIFTPFFTTRQSGRGTGLGLAVTFGIVKMHRGDIKVESNADPAKGPTGTTFTVTLPRQRKGG